MERGEANIVEIIGKKISGVRIDNEGMNPVITMRFSDGTSIEIEYDWLYEIRFNKDETD